MNILVVGTPKRGGGNLPGFDNFVLGLSRSGITFDHYPNILAESYSDIGRHKSSFDVANIRYPTYGAVVDNLKRKRYDLIVTTVCRVDYSSGRHGVFSRMSKKLKYSRVSNKRRMGGTLVLDWLDGGMDLPPLVVIDDSDDLFIKLVDYDLLMRCRLYFKRELPLDRFHCFRLFDTGLDNGQKLRVAAKLRRGWLSYNLDSFTSSVDIGGLKPAGERDIDVSYLCDIYSNYTRIKALDLLKPLSADYRVETLGNRRLARDEFYDVLKRSKIGISLPGRGWDCFRHYELMLFGSALFVTRPYIENSLELKDGGNCVFVENDLSDLESKIRYYLQRPELISEIAQNGHELVKKRLDGKRLAGYVMEEVYGELSIS